MLGMDLDFLLLLSILMFISFNPLGGYNLITASIVTPENSVLVVIAGLTNLPTLYRAVHSSLVDHAGVTENELVARSFYRLSGVCPFNQRSCRRNSPRIEFSAGTRYRNVLYV